MNDHTRPPIDHGRDPVGWPTMREAGEVLDLTPNAIRQRIRRGSLTALKVDGIWRVDVAAGAGDQGTARVRPGGRPAPYDQGADRGDTATHTTGAAADHEAIEARYRVVATELQAEIETRYLDTIAELRQGFEVQLAAITSAKDETIISQQATIAALNTGLEQAGLRMTELAEEREKTRIQAEIAALEREQIAAERDALERRVRELEAVQVESPMPVENAQQERPQRVQKLRQRRWWLRLFGVDE